MTEQELMSQYELIVRRINPTLRITRPLDFHTSLHGPHYSYPYCVLKVEDREREMVLKISEVTYQPKVSHIDREREVLERTIELRHTPLLLRVYSESGYVSILKEFIKGETVEGKCREIDTKMKSELRETVMELHKWGIASFDISPVNVILTLDGRLRLFDFGTCRFEEDPCFRERAERDLLIINHCF